MNLITPAQAEEMNRWVVWSELSREDRRKVRREMLKQAEKMISSGNVAQRKAMARQLVDAAISQENKSLEAWQK